MQTFKHIAYLLCLLLYTYMCVCARACVCYAYVRARVCMDIYIYGYIYTDRQTDRHALCTYYMFMQLDMHVKMCNKANSVSVSASSFSTRLSVYRPESKHHWATCQHTAARALSEAIWTNSLHGMLKGLCLFL